MLDSILREVQKTNPDMTKELLIERLRERWSSAACLAMIEMNGKKARKMGHTKRIRPIHSNNRAICSVLNPDCHLHGFNADIVHSFASRHFDLK